MKKVVTTYKCDFCETEIELRRVCFPLGTMATQEHLVRKPPDGWCILDPFHFCKKDCLYSYWAERKRWHDSEDVLEEGQKVLREKEDAFFKRSSR